MTIMISRKSRISFMILPLVTTGIIAGCGKKSGSGSSIPVKNLAEAEKVVSKAQVHCEDQSHCSPSVALLAGATDSTAYQCTAFLVGDDLIATNSHCIPDDLKKPGSDCHKRISLVFPSVGTYPDLKVSCAQIISASDISAKPSDKPDYAFLRLEVAAKRPILKITHSGLLNNELYKIYKMDPDQSNGIIEANMRESECKVVYGSLNAGGASSVQSKVMGLANCEIEHGNSGSPLVNAAGEAAAIAFAASEVADKAKLVQNLGVKGISFLDHDVAALVLATSYACLQIPNEDQTALNESCGKPAPTAQKAIADLQLLTKTYI